MRLIFPSEFYIYGYQIIDGITSPGSAARFHFTLINALVHPSRHVIIYAIIIISEIHLGNARSLLGRPIYDSKVQVNAASFISQQRHERESVRRKIKFSSEINDFSSKLKQFLEVEACLVKVTTCCWVVTFTRQVSNSSVDKVFWYLDCKVQNSLMKSWICRTLADFSDMKINLNPFKSGLKNVQKAKLSKSKQQEGKN